MILVLHLYPRLLATLVDGENLLGQFAKLNLQDKDMRKKHGISEVISKIHMNTLSTVYFFS